MTSEERLIRLEVGAEIIEKALLDFLRENSDSYFNTGQVHKSLEYFNYHLCRGALERLHSKGRIANHKTGRVNRWQALP